MDFAAAKPLHPRSPHWEQLERDIVAKHPYCAATGKEPEHNDGLILNVHHIRPYHLRPELELEPTNLIVLMGGVLAVHLWLGHLGDWHSFNPHVVEQAAEFLKQVRSRK